MIQWAQFLAWGLKHSELVRDIGNAAVQIKAAESAVERWNIVKPVGDKVAPAVDDFPAFTFSGKVDESRVDALIAKLNDGADAAAKALVDRAFLENALRFLQIILPLIAQR